MSIERIKAHLKDNKERYIIGVVSTVASAGITVLIMRSNIARGAMGGGATRGAVSNAASFLFSDKNTVNFVTVLEREGRGHPGYAVRNLETRRIDLSQKAAAAHFRIPEKVLSGHLNGKFAEVDGLHFERVNIGGE